MSRTRKHQEAWNLHHDGATQHGEYESRRVGRRFGNKRRLWSRLKVKVRRAWRHAFKRAKLTD
jgi:hypothetical protein